MGARHNEPVKLWLDRAEQTGEKGAAHSSRRGIRCWKRAREGVEEKQGNAGREKG